MSIVSSRGTVIYWLAVRDVILCIADHFDSFDTYAAFARTCKRVHAVLTLSRISAQARRFLRDVYPSVRSEQAATSTSRIGFVPFVPSDTTLDWLLCKKDYRVPLEWLLKRPRLAGRWYGWLLCSALERLHGDDDDDEHDAESLCGYMHALIECARRRFIEAAEQRLREPDSIWTLEDEIKNDQNLAPEVPYDVAYLRVPWRRVARAAATHASYPLLTQVLHTYQFDHGDAAMDLEAAAAREILELPGEPLVPDDWRYVDRDAVLLRVIRHPIATCTVVLTCLTEVTKGGVADALRAARRARRTDLVTLLTGYAQHMLWTM